MSKKNNWRRAICLGAVSYVALSIHQPDSAQAQSTSLPPVTVDAPTQRAVKRAAAAPQRAARTTRRAAARRPASPPPQPAEIAASRGVERVTGPVNGFVATRTATGTKTDTPIVEVPQSISVVPADQITAQGAQNISQALRYTPGVFPEPNGAADFSSTFLKLRGFNSDLYLDGLRLPNNPQSGVYSEVEPYNVERIEVLKGPSSGLYGSSRPGGLVNMTSKRPLDTPFREVTVQTGSFERKQVSFDFSDRFAGNPDALFRVVGLARDSNTQFDFQQDKREFIAPSVTLKNDKTTLTFLASYFHADYRANAFNRLPASGTVLFNPNGFISQNFYNGEPTYDSIRREQFTAGYAFEHEFSDAVKFRQNLRYVNSSNDIFGIAPGRQGADPNQSNNPRTGLLIGDPSMQNIRRGAIFTGSDNNSVAIDNQLETKFVTGPFRHTAVFGVDYRTLDSTYVFKGGGTFTTLNLFNPIYSTTPISLPTVRFNDDLYKLDQTGLYAQDQIKLGSWILTIGGRQDWSSSKNDSQLDALPAFGPRDSAFTGRAGLGYQFANGVVPYVSYGTSFEPIVGLDVSRTAFKPTTGEQVEAGVKFQPPGTKTLLTAAVFDITQQNVLTRDALNPNFSVQTGEVNVKGFEFEARAELLDRFSVIAGYTFLDARITKSNIAGEAGNRPVSTPEHQASIWGQYGLGGHLEGLTLGAGVRYVGSTSAFTPAATYGAPFGFVPAFVLTTPAYTLVDAMVSYDLQNLSPSLKGAMLRVNAINLFNKYYIAGCGTTINCFMGTARTVLATLSYRW